MVESQVKLVVSDPDEVHKRPSTGRALRFGLNHNIAYRGDVYHVQTEDSGHDRGHIFTHVFFSGLVIASTKVEYEFEPSDEGTPARIVQLMRDSHKAMVTCLCKGALDERIHRCIGKPTDAPVHRAIPTAGPAPAEASSDHLIQLARINQLREAIDMANVSDSLKKIQTEVSGFLAAALVDHESGMCLGSAGTGINVEVAAAGNTEVVRAKMRVMNELGIRGGVEDILITLQSQYHIIRPVSDSLFLYLAIDRKQGNLAMARHKMAAVGAEMIV